MDAEMPSPFLTRKRDSDEVHVGTATASGTIKQLHTDIEYKHERTDLTADQPYEFKIEDGVAVVLGPPKTYPSKKDPEEKREVPRRVEINGGVFCRLNYNKAGGFNEYFPLQGNYVFGVDRNGLLWVAGSYHDSISKGRNLLFAGEVHFSKGNVTLWNCRSGHHEPDAVDLRRAPFPKGKFTRDLESILGTSKNQKKQETGIPLEEENETNRALIQSAIDEIKKDGVTKGSKAVAKVLKGHEGWPYKRVGFKIILKYLDRNRYDVF